MNAGIENRAQGGVEEAPERPRPGGDGGDHLGWGRTSLLAAVLFLLVGAFYMAPAMTDCSGTVMGGQFGDATAGGVWFAYNYEHAPSPFTSAISTVGAPGPGRLFVPLRAASLTYLIPMWAASHVTSAVCSWNLNLLAALVADGMAVFALVAWLTRRRLVAIVAGYSYAFLPLHIVKLFGHIGYVDSWPLPVLVLAMLMLATRPTRRRALLTSVAVALCWYTDGYYLLFSGVIVGVMAVSAAVWMLWSGRRSAVTLFLRGLGLAGAGCAVLLVPMALLFRSGEASISLAVTRTAADLQTYSARPTDYLFPSPFHPLLGAWSAAHHQLRDSNTSETTLYLGVFLLLLAVAGAVLGVVHRASSLQGGPSIGLVAASMIALAAVSFVFSLPPGYHGLHMPSGFVFRFVQFWRVYARFALVVSIAVTVLASLALNALPRRRLGDVLVFAALPLVAFDFLSGPNLPSYSYARDVNPVYRTLGAEPGQGIVAGFPLGGDPSESLSAYLTYAYVFQKPLFNGSPAGTTEAKVRRAAFDFSDPQSLPILRRYHVQWVVIDDSLFWRRGGTDLDHVEGLQQVASVRGVHLYRLLSGRVASVVLSPAGGFLEEQNVAAALTVRWAGPRAQLDIESLDGHAGPVDVRFSVTPALGPRGVTIRQGGAVVWHGIVPPGTTPLMLHLPSRRPLVIDADPRQPANLNGLILNVTGLDAN